MTPKIEIKETLNILEIKISPRHAWYSGIFAFTLLAFMMLTIALFTNSSYEKLIFAGPILLLIGTFYLLKKTVYLKLDKNTGLLKVKWSNLLVSEARSYDTSEISEIKYEINFHENTRTIAVTKTGKKIPLTYFGAYNYRAHGRLDAIEMEKRINEFLEK